MNNKAFTLLEVLVSVVIVFMIGMTLTKISSQNINIIQSVKNETTMYDSAIINNLNNYRSVNDYVKINETPKIDKIVEKKSTDLGLYPLIVTKQFNISYNITKEIIKVNSETKAYFRIK